MPKNPLETNLKHALIDAQKLSKLFRAFGRTDYVGTPILKAYRATYRSLDQALQAGAGHEAVLDSFESLRASVQASSAEILMRAARQGVESASVQLRNYGDQVNLTPDEIIKLRANAAVGPILAKVDQQESAIMASWLTGPDRSMILGDKSRSGQLRPADVLVTGAVWAAALFWSLFGYMVNDTVGPGKYEKMAVAGLDERTTDCCLRVHGQVQPLSGKFRLKGTPRFADRISWPPFHWYCRTSGVLYQAGYDENLSSLMQTSAKKILDRRAAGLPIPEIHPASAYLVAGL